MCGCIKVYEHLYMSTCVCVRAPMCVLAAKEEADAACGRGPPVVRPSAEMRLCQSQLLSSQSQCITEGETELMSTNTHGRTHKTCIHAYTQYLSETETHLPLSVRHTHTHTHPQTPASLCRLLCQLILTLSISDLFSFSPTPHCTSLPTTLSLSPSLQSSFNTLSHLFSTSYGHHTLFLMKEKNMK